MSFRAATVLVLGLGPGATTPVLPQGKPSDEYALAAPDRRSINGFNGRLVVVKNPRAFARKWLQPDIPRTKSGADVKRGDPLGAFILFIGCRTDAQGGCRLEVDYTVYKPDGGTYAERKGHPLWQERTFPPPNIQLGRAIPAFGMGKDDPAGVYRVKAKVSDLNAHVSLELETTFRVRP